MFRSLFNGFKKHTTGTTNITGELGLKYNRKKDHNVHTKRHTGKHVGRHKARHSGRRSGKHTGR